MAKANLKAVPAKQTNPYDNSGNPLVESSLCDSLTNINSYTYFLYDYACNDPHEGTNDYIQNGRAVALRVLFDALEKVHTIEAARVRGGAE